MSLSLSPPLTQLISVAPRIIHSHYFISAATLMKIRSVKSTLKRKRRNEQTFWAPLVTAHNKRNSLSASRSRLLCCSLFVEDGNGNGMCCLPEESRPFVRPVICLASRCSRSLDPFINRALFILETTWKVFNENTKTPAPLRAEFYWKQMNSSAGKSRLSTLRLNSERPSRTLKQPALADKKFVLCSHRIFKSKTAFQEKRTKSCINASLTEP